MKCYAGLRNRGFARNLCSLRRRNFGDFGIYNLERVLTWHLHFFFVLLAGFGWLRGAMGQL